MERETYRRNIRFFVEPNEYHNTFKNDAQRRRAFEDRAESTFMQHTQEACTQEMKMKQYKLRNAKWFGTKESVEEAEKYPTRSCDLLRELGTK